MVEILPPPGTALVFLEINGVLKYGVYDKIAINGLGIKKFTILYQ